MNKSESKYFNTAQKMDEALIALLKKKPFDYITVKEICDTAGVNRSTFYLHYNTIGDLLAEVLEFSNKRFLSYFSEGGKDFISKIKTCPIKDLILITPRYMEPYLNYIKDNRNIFLATFAHPVILESETKFDQLYQYIFDPIFDRISYPESNRRYIIEFYIHGIMAVIQKWVKDDCKDDISVISDIIIKCIPTLKGTDNHSVSFKGV